MREETERQFKRLLEQHDREFLKRAGPAAEHALRLQEFDRRFHERVQDVVEPVMAKARALLHDHGVQSKIVATQRHAAADGKITPSSIAFQFDVLTDAESHGFPITTPTLSFIADPARNAVLVYEDTLLPFFGGQVGVSGHCTLDELTSETVERHLLAVARKVLRGTGAA